MKLARLMFLFIIAPVIGLAQTKEPLNDEKLQALVELIESYESDSKPKHKIDRPKLIEKFRECYIDPDNTHNIEVISNIIDTTPKHSGWKDDILKQVDEQSLDMSESDRSSLEFGIKYIPGPYSVRKIMRKRTCKYVVENYVYKDGVSTHQLIELLTHISPSEINGSSNVNNSSGFRPY